VCGVRDRRDEFLGFSLSLALVPALFGPVLDDSPVELQVGIFTRVRRCLVGVNSLAKRERNRCRQGNGRLPSNQPGPGGDDGSFGAAGAGKATGSLATVKSPAVGTQGSGLVVAESGRPRRPGPAAESSGSPTATA